MIEKKETIAATMRQLMASGPSVIEYPSYKALNDAVGKVHGLPAGKVQTLAGPKAWAWFADQTTGVWRKATPEEIEAKREAASAKNHGGPRKSKALPDAERAALEAQVMALEQVANPALEPLLQDLKGKLAADDTARKGTLKDRLQVCIDTLGLEQVVNGLERAIAAAAAAAQAPAAETPEA